MILKKKALLGAVMAACLTLLAVPAFAADGTDLQTQINNTPEGGTLTLNQSYDLSESVTIDKELTIDGGGNSINYTGTDSAIKVTAQAPVALNNLTINAKDSGADGIDLISNQPNLSLTGTTINADTRGIDMYQENDYATGKLTITDSSIFNSRVSDYANEAVVGDTRGVAISNIIDSDITISNSNIKGFGYSINTFSDEDASGTRPASNKYAITGSNIWGWSAVNVWTVGNTFDITNCDLRGINSSNRLGNSFSVLNIVKGIYGTSPDTAKHNVFNITGGTLDAKMTVSTAFVEETIAYLGNQYETEFHFEKSRFKKVVMTCDKAHSAIIAEALDANNTMDPAFSAWALSDKLTGPENASYNQGSDSIFFPNHGLIAPGVYAGQRKPSTSSLSVEESSLLAGTEQHVGGDTI